MYVYKSNECKFFERSQSSNMLNQARLKVLKKREDHVRSVLDEARRRLVKSVSNVSLYRDIMEKLILQALYQVCRSMKKILN